MPFDPSPGDPAPTEFEGYFENLAGYNNKPDMRTYGWKHFRYLQHTTWRNTSLVKPIIDAAKAAGDPVCIDIEHNQYEMVYGHQPSDYELATQSQASGRYVQAHGLEVGVYYGGNQLDYEGIQWTLQYPTEWYVTEHYTPVWAQRLNPQPWIDVETTHMNAIQPYYGDRQVAAVTTHFFDGVNDLFDDYQNTEDYFRAQCQFLLSRGIKYLCLFSFPQEGTVDWSTDFGWYKVLKNDFGAVP